VHQFHKVEQVIVDVADKARDRSTITTIVENAEGPADAFELPYRVVAVVWRRPRRAAGDEVRHRDAGCRRATATGETHSASRFYDYQARRLELRYRPKDGGKPLYCHTLNNTVIASPRILIPLLENHQQRDGTVRLPRSCRPLWGRTVIGKPVW
jgi:seryl-tRNA synthetase